LHSPFFNLHLLTCLALITGTVISAHATTITVTNTNDSGPGTLRQALVDVSDGDTIEFAVAGQQPVRPARQVPDTDTQLSGPAVK